VKLKPLPLPRSASPLFLVVHLFIFRYLDFFPPFQIRQIEPRRKICPNGGEKRKDARLWVRNEPQRGKRRRSEKAENIDITSSRDFLVWAIVII
jgi:hypothetical protein